MHFGLADVGLGALDTDGCAFLVDVERDLEVVLKSDSVLVTALSWVSKHAEM